jgi:hypothetical protein
MSKLRVHSFSISFDGYGGGPNQDIENPLLVGGLNEDGPTRYRTWFGQERTWHRMHGNNSVYEACA